MRKVELSKERLGYLLVIPALAVVVGIFLYPFITTLWYSLHSMRLNVPHLGTPWVGIKNYLLLFRFNRFLYALRFTMFFAVVSVGLQLILGIGVALTLHKHFRGRSAVRVSVLAPWAVCLVVAALMWKWMYNASYGIINSVFLQMGLLNQPFDWLGSSAPAAIISCLIATVWRDSPFVAIVVLAGLQSIELNLYDAAEIDGGNRFQVFRFITLPLLKPAILVVLLFQTIHEIRAFDLIFALTQGGPGNATELASLFVYKFTFSFLDFGRGSAAAVVLASLTMILCLIYMRFLFKDEVS